jgi:hypothetical protein
VTAYAGARTVWIAMTAWEKLRERIQALIDAEATEALWLLDLRSAPVSPYSVTLLRRRALSQEDETAAAEGRADLAAGRTVPLDGAVPELE